MIYPLTCTNPHCAQTHQQIGILKFHKGALYVERLEKGEATIVFRKYFFLTDAQKEKKVALEKLAITEMFAPQLFGKSSTGAIYMAVVGGRHKWNQIQEASKTIEVITRKDNSLLLDAFYREELAALPKNPIKC